MTSRRSLKIGLIESKSNIKSINPQPQPLSPSSQALWNSFEPVANQLISIYGAFYNRSHNLESAKRWEALRAQGYKPAKRSPLDLRWWEEERRRGRVQPDHQISWPLQAARSGRQRTKPLTQRSFSSITSSKLNDVSGSKISTTMIRKGSPDILDLARSATEFGLPDFDYGGLDSDSIGDSIPLVRKPGAKGISGLQPGSFIELRRANQSEMGIVVSIIGNEVVYVNRSGEIRLNSLDNVMYTMHNIVDSSIAKKAADAENVLGSITTSVLSTSQSELESDPLDEKAVAITEARKHCCRTLRVTEAKLDRCHAILTKAGSYDLYNHFKHPDRTKTARLSTEQALRFLLGRQHSQDELMLFALHQQLMANSDLFIANARDMRDHSAFSLQSEDTLEALYTVRDWVASDSTELKSFVEKARHVINTKRSLQDPSETSNPLRPVTDLCSAWTASDLLIIKVFRTIAITERMIQDQPLSTIVAAILKKIGLYDKQAMIKTWPALTFDRFGAIVLLRDIGVLLPWQSVGLWDPSLDIESRYRTYTTAKANPKNRDLSGTTPKRTSMNRTRSPTLAVDPSDVLRHDFGDLPVYIIDDPNAEELDDGVSIELVESSSDNPQAWVHVHIADPTTSLDPSHSIALEARKYLETLYMPGFTLPMLPAGFIKTNKLSLGVAGGQRTLTFSALLDKAGNIIQYKIRPGWINCTKQTTYDVVTTILDGKPPSPQPKLTIGQPPECNPMDARPTLSLEQLDADDHSRLKNLATFASALTRRRVADGALGWNLPTPSVTLHSNPSVQPVFGIAPSPQLSTGTPAVTVYLPRPIMDHRTHQWGTSSAQQLVTEFMILAGRLAGRLQSEINSEWFLLPFRTQAPPEQADSLGNLEALRLLRQQISPITGVVSPFIFQKAKVKLLPAMHNLKPHVHSPLGISDEYGYCKVTSPLRRYSDLISHWQIKRALLRSKGLKEYDDHQEVLSEKSMMGLIDRIDREIKPFQMLEKKLNRSWISYLIERLSIQDHHEFKLRGVIMSEAILVRFTNRWTMKVYLIELGIKASLVIKEREDWFGEVEEGKNLIGLCLPVKIVHVNGDDHLVVEVVKERMNEMMMMV
ncbi:uncharacterized protein MELLADRAFT_78142 [Melampsora larici-populina 98AG31]|uniref:RNB domain-containing protein n=1 Tax=Melampsora larici-populina (strain 98AG31 / pathotype 3-4-7) TaxID=747676 RepID=F4RQU7_MELLP|nr:uncharacterized protein MELLADRAFT_78142 [Melampsora larici-populina 98AG31]EGG05103.1 hypothetical protein MELLADRAFT_78142 [Melampsora larici-populina 98AG31]